MEGSFSQYTPTAKSREGWHRIKGCSQLRKYPDESECRKTPDKFTKFAMFNVNSLLKTGKLKNLLNNITQQKIKILALQEMQNTTQESYESQGFRIYQEIPGKRAIKTVPQFGTGFIVDTKIIDSIKDFKPYMVRLASLTVKSANKTYSLINLHAPTSSKNHSSLKEVEEFWDLLEIRSLQTSHINTQKSY